MSLEEAANWLDEVRSDPKYSYTAPWHYVDFPKGTMYQPTNQPNIVNALTHIIAELDGNHNVAGEQIRVDLLCLIHFTAHDQLLKWYAIIPC